MRAISTTQFLTVSETKSGLQQGAKGTPAATVDNFALIMVQDRKYEAVRFNELSNCAEVHNVDKKGHITITRWSDADEAESIRYIEKEYGIYDRSKHSDALRLLFNERRYNPIIDIIEGVKWDGKSRIKEFLARWALVEDTPYSREVSRLIFAGGIHRLYTPGCKFEDVPILMGKQKSGKSTICRFLAINDDYFG